MSSFDRLHPAIQYHIVNSLGWSELRPLQSVTIDPVLAGHHAILLAPTAGGKTEAAMFPVFSRMLVENWSGLSVVYVCPIKALLNNLEPRLEYYASLLGRRVGVWHGDVKSSLKQKILADPPDILLTTPESLEVMLVSRRVDHMTSFANLQCVVIDEVHAFAGDDRGWHLLFVLERLNRIAGREVQRLGLSATVGNPEGLCDWLASGSSAPREVICPPAGSSIAPALEVDWVGNLDNAAVVISRLHRGEKRLVFCDSRSRVEQLSLRLRQLGVDTYVSHSSLSREERRAAEEAFAQGNDCVIVATSTLELGLDVGNLDRVIQIDAPGTVSSFLQRLGRSGRRSDTERNCLFLTTNQESLLKCLALLQLWSEGYVEPVDPPAMPLHLFAQQIMALALQEHGIGRCDWRDWFRRLPGLENLKIELLEQVIDHMLERGILFEDQGLIGVGETGERTYGRNNFMDLFSVFVSPPLVQVLHGKQELGMVHQSTFLLGQGEPIVLSLAGRAWETRYFDWKRRIAYVEPATGKGRSQWLGSDQPHSFELCRAMVRLLKLDKLPVRSTLRAQETYVQLKEDFAWVQSDGTFIVWIDDGSVIWWTFGGKLLNSAIGFVFMGEAERITTDNLAIRFANCKNREDLSRRIEALLSCPDTELRVPLDGNNVDELKFGECLSDDIVVGLLARRFDLGRVWRHIVQLPVVKVKVSASNE